FSGNFTARIKGPYYITAQLSLRGGGQLIFQRPVVKNQNGGVTFGAYYRYDSFAMDLPVGMVSNYHFFHINSIGIRSMVLSTGPFLSFYGFIATGYSPELKTPLFYADLTIPLMKMK
ncbi:MAG TPA: hypothetical protein VKA34_09770, partial [Balneolales bacterium]|nr:hypothetical protein [Balneolales bacterium]